MKCLGRLAFVFFLTAFFNTTHAQRIIVSEPDREDSRRMNFEIIGKMGNNYLVYKNIRSDNFICVYDNEMKIIQKTKHEYMPDERLINVDFFPYQDFVYMIYQYQKRNIVYCNLVKLDGMGKKISEPVELDTTKIGGSTNNKIYTTLTSEDKQKIIIFKINSRNKERYIITTKLYDDKFELLKKSIITMPMEERHDYIGEFAMDNEGNLVFAKYYRTSNENISRAYMLIKKAMEDTLGYYQVNLQKNLLDELRVKVDNTNQRFLLSAFYYAQKRGNIQGLYFLAINRNGWQPEMERTFEFSEDLRQEAKGDMNMKMAFDNYFIRNITVKRDGGFLIDAESYYTRSRSAFNRLDYLYGSPFLSPYDYYFYSPYYSNWWWRRNWNSGGQPVRYHADNVTIFSFNNKGEMEWSNVIRKGQWDDDTDDRISYYVMNTGGQLHFLFNLQERRTLLLNDFSLTPDGKVNRNPTLKGLDKGHEFLPKYGKQISARQFIVPCFYRNYICFAKIDF